MAFLYTPPQWRFVHQLKGALRYGITTSGCVWGSAGNWSYSRNPGVGQLNGAAFVFYTPTIVDSATATSLQAITPDPVLWPDGIGSVTVV